MKRSATIHASIEQVRSTINNLHAWEQWSPWQQLDPEMAQTYTGPESGPGAQMHWVGNKKAGEGRMTVVHDTPTLVEVDIQFIKPFPAQNRSHFELVSVGEHNEHTEVTWKMTGKQSAFMKVMFKVMKMERSIGNDFSRGLAALDAAVQQA